LDVQKVPAELQPEFAAVESRYGVPIKDLSRDTVPVVNAEYTIRLEQAWETQIP